MARDGARAAPRRHADVGSAGLRMGVQHVPGGQDDWREFYMVGAVDHYAGCGRDLDQRWGILQTMFFGNQNGAGQFHRSAYTEGKLRAIAAASGASQAIAVPPAVQQGRPGAARRAGPLSGASAMRIFITGIAGFLGSHLAERLLGDGPPRGRLRSPAGRRTDQRPAEAEFYQYDCRDFNAMAKVMRGAELVYHCAATAYEGLVGVRPGDDHGQHRDRLGRGVLRRHRRRRAADRVLLVDGALRHQPVPFVEATTHVRRTRTASPRSPPRRRCVNLAGVHGAGIRDRRAAQHHRRAAEIRRSRTATSPRSWPT